MSNYKLGHKFVWMELDACGSLQLPQSCGRGGYNVNGWWGGYNSEQEAYEAFVAFKSDHWDCPTSLILLKETSIV